ncbi:hypothetical protein D3C81_489850 [compost metagenome]
MTRHLGVEQIRIGSIVVVADARCRPLLAVVNRVPCRIHPTPVLSGQCTVIGLVNIPADIGYLRPTAAHAGPRVVGIRAGQRCDARRRPIHRIDAPLIAGHLAVTVTQVPGCDPSLAVTNGDLARCTVADKNVAQLQPHIGQRVVDDNRALAADDIQRARCRRADDAAVQVDRATPVGINIRDDELSAPRVVLQTDPLRVTTGTTDILDRNIEDSLCRLSILRIDPCAQRWAVRHDGRVVHRLAGLQRHVYVDVVGCDLDAGAGIDAASGIGRCSLGC